MGEFDMKAIVDTTSQQLAGSLAARFERLLDLYAPMTEQPNGETMRDPSAGIISRDDFVRLLDMADHQSGADE